jgi:hypothetical protein
VQIFKHKPVCGKARQRPADRPCQSQIKAE